MVLYHYLFSFDKCTVDIEDSDSRESWGKELSVLSLKLLGKLKYFKVKS